MLPKGIILNRALKAKDKQFNINAECITCMRHFMCYLNIRSFPHPFKWIVDVSGGAKLTRNATINYISLELAKKSGSRIFLRNSVITWFGFGFFLFFPVAICKLVVTPLIYFSNIKRFCSRLKCKSCDQRTCLYMEPFYSHPSKPIVIEERCRGWYPRFKLLVSW